MKRTAILALCIVLIASVALADGDSARRARDTKQIPAPTPIIRGLVESFEEGVPPPGWTAVVNSAFTWGTGTYNPVHGLAFASCEYAYPLEQQDEWLLTDYTIEAGDECLCFYAMASYYWAVTPYSNYNILVTIDGVVVWDYFTDYGTIVNYEWWQYCVDLTGYSIGDTIEIGLGYQGMDGAQGGFDLVQIGECFPDPPPPPPQSCPFPHVCWIMDFNICCGEGVTYDLCNGVDVWEFGSPAPGTIPDLACDDVPVTHVLGTVLSGDYLHSSGHVAIVGELDHGGLIEITDDCPILEICHYYYTEGYYDGGNVKVSVDGVTWTLIHPEAGYPEDSITTSNPCIPSEPAFSGDSVTFVRDCFDLSQYVGQTIMIGFFFGSDSSVSSYPGWYIKWIKVGGEEISPVEGTSWGSIKALYR